MREKLLVGRYTVQWRCQLLQTVVQSRAEFYMVHISRNNKKLRDNPCYTVQLSDKVSRNGIVRQLRSVTWPLKV